MDKESVRSHNIGKSDYAKHKIQPWDVWCTLALNPWDADIIKRVLRNKEGEEPEMDYEKIRHICDERIRQEEVRMAKQKQLFADILNDYDHLTEHDKSIINIVFHMDDSKRKINLYEKIFSFCNLRLAKIYRGAPQPRTPSNINT